MSDAFEPFSWACFEPQLQVSGIHSAGPMPIAPELQAGFGLRHPQVLEAVLARPGGFDGRRAALKHWTRRPGELRLCTGERSYTEGLVMARLIRERKVPPPSAETAAGWSWGTTLASLVLLPGQRILVGRRAEQLQSAPGRWAAVFTEVLEPPDISLQGMQSVLARLAAEELAALQHLGRHDFVGLLRLAINWEWVLVAVLDLREVPGSRLNQALAALAPDAETVAWDSLPLGEAGDAENAGVVGMRLVREVHARLRAS